MTVNKMSDRNIQGFDIETSECRDILYALLRAVMKGARRITNVEKQSQGDQHTVYITSEKK